MDDNVMKLINELVDTAAELAEYKQRERDLIKLLWKAEIAEAKTMVTRVRYEGLEKYAEISTAEVRDLFGIMPCPEALNILKAAREEDCDGPS